MTAAVPAGRVDRWAAPGALAAGLDIAARSHGLTFIAVPAPVAAAASLVDALRDQPRVAWTSGELTLVGTGCARELRGSGDDRWADIVRGARAIGSGGAGAGAGDGTGVGAGAWSGGVSLTSGPSTTSSPISSPGSSIS